MELRFSHDAARLLVREQRLYSPEWHKILTDKNVDDLCNVVRKSGGKNANWMPDRGPKVSIITKDNLKLAISLFHHWWRCTIDWEVMGVQEDTVHLLIRQKRLKGEYKDLDMLPKVNKADMAEAMEPIKINT